MARVFKRDSKMSEYQLILGPDYKESVQLGLRFKLLAGTFPNHNKMEARIRKLDGGIQTKPILSRSYFSSKKLPLSKVIAWTNGGNI